MIDPLLIALGFLVGIAVGLTGIGGGALLTPLLIVAIGVRPTVAVGTDLAFAAITKTVGAWQHTRRGTVDLVLVRNLACGSVPGALFGAWIVGALKTSGAADADAVVARILGFALLLAAGASLLRVFGLPRTAGPAAAPGPLAAGVLGLGVGVLVGLTSVGAGSLLMAAFALLYGLPVKRMVGTDILHGAVLAAVAAVAHGAAGRVEVGLLVNLLAGSVAGVLLGGWLCARLPGQPVRVGIAVMLAVAGLRLV